MPAALKILASGQLAATTAATVLTVAGSTSAKIASASISNKSAAAVTVTVSVVPAGATYDGTRDVLAAYSLAAGDAITHRDVLSMLDGAMLDAGATLVLTAGTTAALNYLVTGAVIS